MVEQIDYVPTAEGLKDISVQKINIPEASLQQHVREVLAEKYNIHNPHMDKDKPAVEDITLATPDIASYELGTDVEPTRNIEDSQAFEHENNIKATSPSESVKTQTAAQLNTEADELTGGLYTDEQKAKAAEMDNGGFTMMEDDDPSYSGKA